MPMVCDPCWHAWRDGYWGPGFRGTHCSGCHQSWTAMKQAHCRECHQSFSADSLAERHRDGDRCLSPEELRGLVRKNGECVMRLDGGVWRYAQTFTGKRKAVSA